MNYDGLRHAADSWGLLFMVCIFLLAMWRAVRPSARPHHEDAAQIPFRDESLSDD